MLQVKRRISISGWKRGGYILSHHRGTMGIFWRVWLRQQGGQRLYFEAASQRSKVRPRNYVFHFTANATPHNFKIKMVFGLHMIRLDPLWPINLRPCKGFSYNSNLKLTRIISIHVDPLDKYEWSIDDFSLEYRHKVKQKDDDSKENY